MKSGIKPERGQFGHLMGSRVPDIIEKHWNSN